MSRKPVVYHIPVCPFSQRLEILLELKGIPDRVDFSVVDITVPRPTWLLELTDGTTALPVLQTEEGRIIKESLVILNYLEDRYTERPVARSDPYERAVENMLIAREGPFTTTGYLFVMNQDRAARQTFLEKMTGHYRDLDSFLRKYSPEGPFLFDRFGLAETVFTPMFMRFWFLEYYEGFALPEDGLERVRAWRDACLAEPAAAQVTREEIIKLYYDYAQGAGNGALLPGRTRSSFVFDPGWRNRPWPPQAKYGSSASDAELGLV
ncbi:glutathione S-transferase family protein [Nitratireductor mangrovi]|uniref:Glutathione S-transferase family protein n=1 Tax=Nitratireductor mangrovi TaxID=2599600 RepID=A0A5B8L0T7_9HYPH|nr:glutathione S-transferase family protein [Nitratireductor mangrovi]QDZ01188.1 glutathione S-transferase family protein [Nitratireductor mangrovi]